MRDRIPVGISSCLLGNEVRHDGGHKRDAYINGTLAEFFELRPFCPEVAIGLGVPRPPIRLVEQSGEVRAVGVKDAGLDVTERLRTFSRAQSSAIEELCGFILKRASPSCGMERVKLYNAKGLPEPRGVGLFAKELMANFPNLPVEEEGRLGDVGLRENFIQRVLIFHHWKTCISPSLTPSSLTAFHGRLKLTLMSHQQDACRELGRTAAMARADNLVTVAERYLSLCMATLKIRASRGNHVNVLQHIQGYLKRELDADDKAELVEIIEQYGRGDIPLIVPVTLLRHHFRHTPDPYIDNSWYMSPFPTSLRLGNLL